MSTHTSPSNPPPPSYNEDDYPSSSDETLHSRRHRNRTHHTTQNITSVRRIISTPPTRDVTGRAYIAALNTIREDPHIRAQLQRIEEIWTLQRDRALADILYTEVTLAIVTAADAVARAGRRWEGEGEEEWEARREARRRTVGDFKWGENGEGSGVVRRNGAERGELDAIALKRLEREGMERQEA